LKKERRQLRSFFFYKRRIPGGSGLTGRRAIRIRHARKPDHPSLEEAVFLIETLFLVNIRKILYNSKAVSGIHALF